MPETLKRILLTILVVIVAAFLVNYNFFWFQLKSLFQSRAVVYQQSNSNFFPARQKEPNMLEIESLNIRVPIIYTDQAGEKVFQEALKNGVAHYPGTAKPGEPGNCYIFGHSSDFIWSQGSYKTVFASLPKIQKGDKIVVSNEKGEPFAYIATETAISSPDDVRFLDQGDYKKKILTLQTSYPVGTALKRFIVIAEIK
jgi:LPXTG-site transpeptidase (sortase) family protein